MNIKVEYYEASPYFSLDNKIECNCNDMGLGDINMFLSNSCFKIDFRKVKGYVYFDLKNMTIGLLSKDKDNEYAIVLFIKNNIEVFKHYARN